LEWEANRKFEVAVEASFFGDRLGIVLSYYDNRSQNQLLTRSIPSITGFSGITQNLPAKIRNTGLEIELTKHHIRKENLQWYSKIQFSVPRNTLLAYPGLEQSADALRYAIGQPLSVAMVYEAAGIDPQTGEVNVIDRNQDGTISVADRDLSRFRGTVWHGGWQSSLSYRNIDVDVAFQFSRRSDNRFLTNYGLQPGGISNQSAEVLDRWRAPAESGSYPRYTTIYSQSFANWLLSDAGIGYVSFLRLTNVHVGYTLPPSLFKHRIPVVRIFFQGQNLFTLTRFKGLDPAFPNDSFLPPLRVFSAGFSLTL